MALYDKAKLRFDNPHQFAIEALKRERVGIERIVRVLPPRDTGDFTEALFLDSFKRPCTAFIDEGGVVVEYHVGW